MAVATRAEDLVASGILLADGPDAAATVVTTDDGAATPTSFRLIVPAAVRKAGQGAITLEVDTDGWRITEATLIWSVTTNKGWAHLRGLARTRPGRDLRPFRADLFAASTQSVPGDDRIALRLYEPDADPNVAGPSHKLQGRLPRGSIRLGA